MEKLPHRDLLAKKDNLDQQKGLTRRGFLKTMAGGMLASAAGGVLVQGGVVLYQKRNLALRALMGANAETSEAVGQAKKFLKEEYDVDVQLGDSWDELDSSQDELTLAESTAALERLIEEMGKYPQDFFKRNKLATIRIAKNVQRGNPWNSKSVGGLARMDKRKIVLNYYPHDEEFFRGVIHHEIYHVLDFWRPGGMQSDLVWDQIHQGCTCTPGSQREKYKGDVPHDRSFITAYGASSAVEERADFAEIMMVHRTHADFLTRVTLENESDRAALERKYVAIREDFSRWSDGLMDDAYWDAVVARAPEKADKETIDREKVGYFYTSDYSSYESGDTYSFEALNK